MIPQTNSWNGIKINTAAIPSIEMRILSNTLIKAVEQFFETPENQADFKRWKKERAKPV
ncbi:MAG: hypothetical protein FWF85_05910 [Clostridiales bacterium]|nr:hypothetical protein [Clostridiales bacterium]